jgi:predicted dehydrogenase
MLRLGVLGAGAWGLNHIRTAVHSGRCELTAIGDPDPRARARATEIAPDAKLYADTDRVLADPQIDAVIVATPAPSHPAIAMAAFTAGKHALIEKPVAMSSRDAASVAAAATSAGRIAMVGHLMLYHPAVVRLHELLRSGSLGTLHYLHSTRVNLGRLRRDENALWSFGPHDVSMIDFLLDRTPLSVTARGMSVLQPGVEDVVFLALRYATGEMAHVHLSWLSPRKERRLTLICSQKMVEFDDVAAEKLRIYDKGYDRPPEFTEYAHYLTLRDGDVHIPRLPMQEPLRLQFEHFLDCIEQGTSPRSGMEAAIRVTSVLEAAQQSLERDGSPVQVTVTH